MKEDRQSPFRDAHSDRDTAEHVPDTPQTRSPAYRLAFADEDFLCRDELRPVRLQLELLKPQMLLDESGIESTIVLFGGARIPEPAKKDTARTQTLADLSHFYDVARRIFAVDDSQIIRQRQPRKRDRHRWWAGGDGGRQPWRRRGWRCFDRVEHRSTP